MKRLNQDLKDLSNGDIVPIQEYDDDEVVVSTSNYKSVNEVNHTARNETIPFNIHDENVLRSQSKRAKTKIFDMNNKFETLGLASKMITSVLEVTYICISKLILLFVACMSRWIITVGTTRWMKSAYTSQIKAK